MFRDRLAWLQSPHDFDILGSHSIERQYIDGLAISLEGTMPLQWSDQLEIGDPIVDSEHRYLVQLIVNLHEQYTSGKVPEKLAGVFTHLAMYVKTHFENEEKLMEAVGYPELEQHRELHRGLVSQAVELSEQYMDGSETISEEVISFLESWAVDHISDSDMKIGKFLRGKPIPDLNLVPAFAIRSGSEFKKCTFCGKTWDTFEDLKSDDEIVLKGCQLDQSNHLYNLILFDCGCETTLGMFINEFMTRTDIPFVINEREDTSRRPDYCLRNVGDECLPKCACAYTGQILDALGKGRRGEIVE